MRRSRPSSTLGVTSPLDGNGASANGAGMIEVPPVGNHEGKREDVVRVWVVEDQDAIRELVTTHLRQQKGIVIAGSSRTTDPMIDAVIRGEIDVVVLDLLLEGAGGLSALEVLKGIEPQPRVVIFSGVATAHTVQTAVEWGVSGYVEKSAALVELNEAIDRARTSGAYFSSGPSGLIRQFIQRRSSEPEYATLTARDRLILQQTALGIPTKRIAESLRLSEPSIYKIKKTIMRKLEVNSDQELTLCALSMGLIQPRNGQGPAAIAVG